MKHRSEKSWSLLRQVLVCLCRFRKDYSGHASAYRLRKAISAVCLAQILFMSTSVPAEAATSYVRPSANGPYGSGDGSSYAEAFSGFGAVSVSSGDTLKVCGSFTSADASTHNILLKFGESGTSGDPTVIDGDCSADGDLAQATLDASGLQFGIYIWNGSSYITVKNIELFGVNSEPRYNRFLLRLGSTSGGDAVSNIIVSNMRIHDVVHLSDTTEANGIWGACNDCTIEENEIYNIPSDGIWLGQAENTEIINNYVHDVATSGMATGDCVQIANAPNAVVQGNVLDHSNTDAKQALIVQIGSTNVQVKQNQLIMSTARDQTQDASKTAFILSDGVVVSGNYITGGAYGMQVGGNNVEISNNVIANTYVASVLAGDNNNAQYWYNNTVHCSGQSSSGFVLSGINYRRTLKNNIIVGCDIPVLRLGTPSEFVFENNLLFNNAQNVRHFTMSDNNINGDPNFENISGAYSSPVDYIPSFGSLAIDAGVDVGLTTDFRDARIVNNPDIGAFEVRPPIQPPRLRWVR